jgi:hypothetical protein
MSLVEATIILLVLMLLTGVMAPSIFDFVNDARTVKVKEDCELVGINVARLVRDVGQCLKFDGRLVPLGPGCTRLNRVDLLFSSGPDVLAVSDFLTGAAAVPFTHTEIEGSTINWNNEETRGDSMEDQWVTNIPEYPNPGAFVPPNWLNPKPWFNMGWRGAYMQSPVGPDPWGRRYLVNTAFLAVAHDATIGFGEGQRSGGWDHDVFCLSAGFNGLYETFYGGSSPFNGGTSRGGDDYVYIIQGSTR